MKRVKNLLSQLSVVVLLLLSAFISIACSNKARSGESNPALSDGQEAMIIQSRVLTKAEQDKLTPQMVIDTLKKRNAEFVNDALTIRNNPERVRDAAAGQYPKAVILSCLDSRVPVEDVFHCGIGDLFVARVAGNIANDDILGSLEYACKVSGSKVVVVLGHESCGAIKSAIDNVKLGNISTLLQKIEPAVAVAKQTYVGEHSSKNNGFVEEVCYHNVLLTKEYIREHSPILKEMEEKGEIMIVGAIYNLGNGEVIFLE